MQNNNLEMKDCWFENVSIRVDAGSFFSPLVKLLVEICPVVSLKETSLISKPANILCGGWNSENAVRNLGVLK